jgi:hypothetical protein
MKTIIQYINERGPAPVVNKSTKAIVLLDTYNYDDTEDNDIDDLIDDFNEQLEKADKEHEGYLIVGTLGLWNGKKDIYPEYYSDLMEAYQKCINNSDDVIVKLIDGALEISAMHHDGTNELYIKALTRKGAEVMHSYTEGYEDDYFEDMDDDEFMKKFLNDKSMVEKFDLTDFDL